MIWLNTDYSLRFGCCILWLLGFICTVYTIGKSVVRYRKYDSMDITTRVLHDDKVVHMNKTTDVPFPVIVICNNSPHSRKKCKSNFLSIGCIIYV